MAAAGPLMLVPANVRESPIPARKSTAPKPKIPNVSERPSESVVLVESALVVSGFEADAFVTSVVPTCPLDARRPQRAPEEPEQLATIATDPTSSRTIHIGQLVWCVAGGSFLPGVIVAAIFHAVLPRAFTPFAGLAAGPTG
jgi:hypothetical protein